MTLLRQVFRRQALNIVFNHQIPSFSRSGSHRAHVCIGDRSNGTNVTFRGARPECAREALRGTVSAVVDGERVPVFTAEHLAAIALDTGRAKHKLRLTQFLAWDRFDRQRFDTIIAEHPALLAKWAAFRRQFPDEE